MKKNNYRSQTQAFPSSDFTPRNISFSRLPDTHRIQVIEEAGYIDYGRFAVTTSGNIVVSGINSSHPSNTKTGWYWAVDSGGNLTVSPRGAQLDNDELLKEDQFLLRCLIAELKKKHILPKSGQYTLIQEEAW